MQQKERAREREKTFVIACQDGEWCAIAKKRCAKVKNNQFSKDKKIEYICEREKNH